MDPIEVLRERRKQAQDALDKILETPTAENRNFTADEDTAFRALADEIRDLDTRIAELVDLAKRKADAAEARRLSGDTGTTATTAVTQVNEPDIYIRGGKNGNSWFRDVGNVAIRRDSNAVERLQRHTDHELRALGNTGAVGGAGGKVFAAV